MSAIWKIEAGQIIESCGKLYKVTQLLDLTSVLCKSLDSGKFEKLNISDLKLASIDKGEQRSADFNSSSGEELDLGNISDEKWELAVSRSEAVKRLLQLSKITKKDVETEAALLGVSRATMYRYINQYTAIEKVSSLIPNASSGGRGKKRISEESEKILEATINEFYLTKQNRKTQKVIREYKRRCFNAGIKPAHDNTVRNRIRDISDKDKARRQGKKALQKLLPTPGVFPEGDFPFQVVQIDHTPVDLQIVDDITRLSIGRIWLTVIIDVFSRMILGFHLSPDSPSVHSVGLCITHAVLPKEKELLRLSIQGEWNCWGLFNKIHADNAGEFRSRDLQRSCQEYGIDIEWRPVSKPHYGAHIERLLGTFMQEVHELPGTTFSSIKEKRDYDSEKEAVFTFTEFERWLTTYITGVYHKTKHEGIGMAPEVKFEQGLFIGSDDFGPVGIPPKIMDERKFSIDFLPTEERTIQQFGVEIELIRYYDSVLSPYIGSKDPDMPKYARKFIFKRNPRALKVIHFYHPDLKQYFEIPYRNLGNPPITIWELKSVRNKLKDQGTKVESETQIFEALNQMREIEESAIKETKTARRNAQRQRIYDEQNKRHNLTGLSGTKSPNVTADSKTSNPSNSKSGNYSDFFNISEDEIKPLEVDEF